MTVIQAHSLVATSESLLGFSGNLGLSLPSKTYQVAKDFLYSVYLENPYDLIFGSLNQVSIQQLSVLDKVGAVSVAAITSVFSLVLYGSTIYVAGMAISEVGSANGYDTVAQVGNWTKELGKNVFLGGAVPLYTVSYLAPKKIIEISPDILLKIEQLSHWVFSEFLEPFWSSTIRPVVGAYLWASKGFAESVESMVDQFSEFFAVLFCEVLVPSWNPIIYPALEEGFNTAVGTAKWMWNNLTEVADSPSEDGSFLDQVLAYSDVAFSRLHDLALQTFNEVIVPSYEEVVVPFWNSVDEAAAFFWSSVLHPVLDPGVKTYLWTSKGFAEGVESLVNQLCELAVVIFKEVLIPLWEPVIYPTLQKGLTVMSQTALEVPYIPLFLVEVADKIMGWVCRQILLPSMRLFATQVLPWVWNEVVYPVGVLTDQATDAVIERLFRYLINPICAMAFGARPSDEEPLALADELSV